LNEQIIGQLQANVATLTNEVHDLRNEVKDMNAQLNKGAGAVKVLWVVGGLLTSLLAGAAWLGQHFKPF